MHKLIFLSFVWISLALTSFHFEPKQAEEWEVYKGKTYTMSYPKSWEFSRVTGSPSIEFILKSPKLDEKSTIASLNLSIQDLSKEKKEMTFDEFVNVGEKAVMTLFKNAKLVESKRETKNELEYHKVIISGKFKKSKLYLVQYYCLKNKKGYVISYSATTKIYPFYEADMNKMLTNFEVF